MLSSTLQDIVLLGNRILNLAIPEHNISGKSAHDILKVKNDTLSKVQSEGNLNKEVSLRQNDKDQANKSSIVTESISEESAKKVEPDQNVKII